MNILFLSMVNVRSLQNNGIYGDLLRAFVKNGHTVYAVTPNERRNGENTSLLREENAYMLRVKTGNLQKTNLLEKGVSTLRLEGQFIRAIKKYFKGVTFDLVLYSTPPITFAKVVEFIKKRDGAKTYLLLKDIFPQNAVDIGILKKSGIKGFIYRYFRKKEKKLYALSDKIGCMSEANCTYLLRENPEIPKEKVEVCPNSVEPIDFSATANQRRAMREKYKIPQDKTVFVYGGNLGKPQGIGFVKECLAKLEKHEKAYFLIVGDGTEYASLQAWFDEHKPENMQLLRRLPKTDYDRLVAACDVGLIFLDKRFTIPNFPSRLLGYMQARLPVLCCTDANTDVGETAEKGEFGWRCIAGDAAGFVACVERALESDLKRAGDHAYEYLLAHYTAEAAYQTIVKGIEK